MRTDTVPDDVHETSRAIQKLAPGAGPYSHDVHMIPDLGKHCYVSPRFMRRREGRPKSPQVAVFHTQSAWAAETPV